VLVKDNFGGRKKKSESSVKKRMFSLMGVKTISPGSQKIIAEGVASKAP